MSRNEEYTALLMRHRKMLWRMCRRRAHGNHALCCDLMQDVSVAMWLNFDKLRPDAGRHQERAWVCWQARTVLYQAGRRRRPYTEPLTDDMCDSLVDENTPDRSELLKDLLASLDPEEQRIVSLWLDGYHGDEIGECMGLSRDTVYQRMHRAVLKMRRAALVVLALLLTTAVSVAVVSHWRHDETDAPEADTVDTVLQGTDTKTSVVQLEPDADTLPIRRASRPAVDKIERLPPMEVVPCTPDAPKPLSENQDISIWVDGCRIKVVGAEGEMVRIYDMHGNLVASQISDGMCTITLFPNGNYLCFDPHSYRVQIGNRPAFLLTL